MNVRKILLMLCLGFLINQANATETQMITGAGSTAAAPIYRSWASEYQAKNGVALTYESIGSTAGFKKMQAGQTGFGASDIAPTQADLKKDGLVMFPIAATGISPVVNLPKIADAQLRLSGSVLGLIFLGTITQWNDPAIVQLNPDVSLPALAIKVVARSDGSGTTYNFSDYLAKVNPVWKEKFGVKANFPWPANFITVKGSDDMVATVKETVGAIGYVDFSYIKGNRLHTVQLPSLEGDYVQPSASAFRIAVRNSDWSKTGNFSSTLTNMPGKGAWPITMGTFVLVPQIASNLEQSRNVLQFFSWAFVRGDAMVQKHNFVQLPERVQAQAFNAIASVKDVSGKTMDLTLSQK